MSSPIEIKYVVYNGENDEFGDIRGELQITFQVQNTKINYGINFARNIKQYYDLSVGIVNGNQTEFINNISLNTRWRLACRMDKISDTFTGIQYDLSNPEIIELLNVCSLYSLKPFIDVSTFSFFPNLIPQGIIFASFTLVSFIEILPIERTIGTGGCFKFNK